MEDYVTYEQAVKLKELGFDWDVHYLYTPNKEFEHIDPELFDYGWDINYDYVECLKGSISAPTLAQAQKWLREVKQIDLFVTKELSKYYWYIGKEFQIGNCDTYEQSLSLGIDKALELLK